MLTTTGQRTYIVRSRAALYPSLGYLQADSYIPGLRHPIIREANGVKDVSHIHTKTKIVTGTYVLQTNRTSFNQNQTSPSCLLCKGDSETAEHFLLQCPALNSVRQPILEDIVQAFQGLDIPLDTDNNGQLMQLLLDSTAVLRCNKQS